MVQAEIFLQQILEPNMIFDVVLIDLLHYRNVVSVLNIEDICTNFSIIRLGLKIRVSHIKVFVELLSLHENQVIAIGDYVGELGVGLDHVFDDKVYLLVVGRIFDQN